MIHTISVHVCNKPNTDPDCVYNIVNIYTRC